MWIRHVYNQSRVRFNGHSILHVGLEASHEVRSVLSLPLGTTLHWVDSLREHHHFQRSGRCMRKVRASVCQIHLSMAYHKLLRSWNPMLRSLHACLHSSQQSQEEKTEGRCC